MRVLVTGSRLFDDQASVWGALDQVAAEALRRRESTLTVVHGACPPRRPPQTERGGDHLASLWVPYRARILAARGLEVVEEPHPADWRLGRGAGFTRNRAMVDTGVDLCLAFLRLDRKGVPSGGAAHTLAYARKREVPCRVWVAKHSSPRARAEPSPAP